MADNTYRFGNHSDIGLDRPENQDYFGYFKTHLGELFIVCDGAGGENGGAIASQLAVNAVHTFFEETDLSDPFRALAGAIAYANTAIRNRRTEDKELSNMATTIVAFLLQPGSKPFGWIAHLGDSRFYRIRQGKIEQITKDHSQVQEMVDHGIITAEEAEGHSNSHIISRYLGMDEDKLNIDISKVDICRNDRYISCTDGVSGMMSDDDILNLSKKQKTPQKLCSDIIDLANENGGHDNSTAQVIDIKKGPNPPGAVKRLALRAAVAVIPILIVIGGFMLLGKQGEPPVPDPNDYPDTRIDAHLIIPRGTVENTITATDSIDWFRIDTLLVDTYTLLMQGDEGISFEVFENQDLIPMPGIEPDTTLLLAEGIAYDISVKGVLSSEGIPLAYTISLIEQEEMVVDTLNLNLGENPITFKDGISEVYGQFYFFSNEEEYNIEILEDASTISITLMDTSSSVTLFESEPGQSIEKWSCEEDYDYINVVMTSEVLIADTYTVIITLIEEETPVYRPNPGPVEEEEEAVIEDSEVEQEEVQPIGNIIENALGE